MRLYIFDIYKYIYFGYNLFQYPVISAVVNIHQSRWVRGLPRPGQYSHCSQFAGQLPPPPSCQRQSRHMKVGVGKYPLQKYCC